VEKSDTHSGLWNSAPKVPCSRGSHRLGPGVSAENRWQGRDRSGWLRAPPATSGRDDQWRAHFWLASAEMNCSHRNRSA